MFLAILTFIAALTISGVAIYYSVAGLAAIFAAALVPIIIMGVTLELGKLITVVWLHRNWKRAVWWLKSYLTIAVVILMFITSMGIFGYLSKAHIEQTSMSIEQVAQIESLDEKLIRSDAKIVRWTNEIDRLLKGDDVRVDTLVEKEQLALTKIYARINDEKTLSKDQADREIGLHNADVQVAQKQADKEINLQTAEKESARTQANTEIELHNADKKSTEELADREIKLQNDRLDQARERKESDIAAAQAKFEKTAFGGSGTFNKAVEKANEAELTVATAAQRELRDINSRLVIKLDKINVKIEAISTKLTTQLATIDNEIEEINKTLNKKLETINGKIEAINKTLNEKNTTIETTYADSITDIKGRIKSLRDQANNKTQDIDTRLAELENFIDTEILKLEDVREEKAVFEKQYRELEADVGPIKYIAEFVYDQEADADLLERAVRWVIIIIIVVFDPLAVLLLVASQYSFHYRDEKYSGGFLGSPDDDPDPTPNPFNSLKEKWNPITNFATIIPDKEKPVEKPVDEPIEDLEPEPIEEPEPEPVKEPEPEPEPEPIEEDTEPQVDLEIDEKKNTEEPLEAESFEELEDYLDALEKDFEEDYEKDFEDEFENLVEPERLTEEEIDALDDDPTWYEAKRQWKDENPNLTIKSFKEKYLRGDINVFPWQEYMADGEPLPLIRFEGKTYIQNEEQTNSTLWNKVRGKHE